jgi:predicted nucleotidyltransferase
MKQVVFLKNDLINAYAGSFASYLISNLGENGGYVNSVILYGSSARGEAREGSDIDVFVDTSKDISKIIEKIASAYRSTKQSLWFRSQGINNDISIKSGKLSSWKDLHRSISSTGIVLWSRFVAEKLPVGTRHRIIFYWDGIGKNRGAFLNKLYGFRAGNKRYAGLLEKWGGFRMGKSCVILPIKYKNEMIKFIRSYKVNAKNIEVFSME